MALTFPYRTLSEAIACIAHDAPDNGFTFQNAKGVETRYSFPELERATAARAAALTALGVRPHDRVALLLLVPEEFIITFLALVRLKAIAVPLPPPPYLCALDVFRDGTVRVLRSCGARWAICSASVADLVPVGETGTQLERVVCVDDLMREHPPIERWPSVDPTDIVFLQYTSGTTGPSKGVTVSHEQLLANVKGFVGPGLQMDPTRDVGVTWLPLHHDMGLVGFVAAPICGGISIVFIPTLRFVVNPSSWFDAIHRHRGTVSFGPNFAYALAARKVKARALEQWDLSCVKAFGCGAEPISPQTLRRFQQMFEPCGVSPRALLPAYGLAESTLAVTLKPLHDEMRTWHVNAPFFQSTGEARASCGDGPSAEHVSCGVPFPGHEVAIMDASGGVRPERHEGEICVRGPSVTRGYWDDGHMVPVLDGDGWLRTGDLGYMRDGELYVTGRSKDLIIINGRKLHPQSIEWIAGEVPGVKHGSVIAFSVPGEVGEEVVVALEASTRDRDRLKADVDNAVRRSHLLPRVEVLCLSPGELPKTASGKVQRDAIRRQYLRSQVAGLS